MLSTFIVAVPVPEYDKAVSVNASPSSSESFARTLTVVKPESSSMVVASAVVRGRSFVSVTLIVKVSD